jgi:hypothetical protein
MIGQESGYSLPGTRFLFDIFAVYNSSEPCSEGRAADCLGCSSPGPAGKGVALAYYCLLAPYVVY